MLAFYDTLTESLATLKSIKNSEFVSAIKDIIISREFGISPNSKVVEATGCGFSKFMDSASKAKDGDTHFSVCVLEIRGLTHILAYYDPSIKPKPNTDVGIIGFQGNVVNNAKFKDFDYGEDEGFRACFVFADESLH